MASPLSNARAAMLVIQQERESTWYDEWLSKAEREACDKHTIANDKFPVPGDYYSFVMRQMEALDPKDKRIAMLEGHILLAYDGLSSWLTDNTDEVFEEQPEIDGIRSDLWDAVHQ